MNKQINENINKLYLSPVSIFVFDLCLVLGSVSNPIREVPGASGFRRLPGKAAAWPFEHRARWGSRVLGKQPNQSRFLC